MEREGNLTMERNTKTSMDTGPHTEEDLFKFVYLERDSLVYGERDTHV